CNNMIEKLPISLSLFFIVLSYR
ncbi:hypothetical protein MIX80_11425, partial [Staphylococcus aureus]|nr:hypothetical protein [Staphylococcus aureus]